MIDKTAKQLLKLVINGVGLKTTLYLIAYLCYDAAGEEDIEMQCEDKQSPFHRASYEIGRAAGCCHPEDLTGRRIVTGT